MEGISLGKLARLAGVSKTTASLILNGKWERYKISKETRQRVLKVAEENNYKPNVFARNLSMGKSMTVGVFVPGLDQYEHAAIVEQAGKELNAAGYHIMPGFTGNDAEVSARLLADMTGRKVDGIIQAGEVLPLSDLPSDIPVVSVGTDIEGIPSVSMDTEAGIKKLIGYWYPRGKRSIAYIGLKKGNEDKKRGFMVNYVERFSMRDDGMFKTKNENDEQKMKKILSAVSGKGFNAVMFETPALVFTALKVLKEAGFGSFEDTSFGCIGYSPFFKTAAKDIVGITVSPGILVKDGVEMLVNLMQKKGSEAGSKRYEPELLF